MSLTEETQDVLTQLLSKIEDNCQPPGKFNDAWRFVSDDDDYPTPDFPNEPYNLQQLTKWADATFQHCNYFRLWTHKVKGIEGAIQSDNININNEITEFFKSDSHWTCSQVGGYLSLTYQP